MATAIANQPQASSTFPPSLTWSFSVSGTVTGTWEASLWSAPYYEGAYNQLPVVVGSTQVTGTAVSGGTVTVTYGTPTTSYYYQVRVTGGGITGTVISTPLYFYSPYQGPQGVQGQQGTRGTQGPTGITGPQGQRGIQGLMEINNYTVPNQLLTSAEDSVHVNPNPTLTFNGTVLALTGNMNASGTIATSAGFTGPTVSTSGKIYSGGFTGPAASTINGISIDPTNQNMTSVGTLNTSGTIATSAGFTGPTVSTSGKIYSGGFTGPASSTINGISINPTNQNMTNVGTISASSGSSSIGGVTLDTNTITASGKIYSGGFTGPLTNTINNLSIGTNGSINTSGVIATSAGFTGLSFSATNFVTAAGGFTGPSVSTINGISIGLTNQGMTGVSSINGVVFGAGTSSATQTISALGKISSGGFTGPAASTINGIGIDPTNQNMTSVGTISASSGSSSIGGVTLNASNITTGTGSNSVGGVTLNASNITTGTGSNSVGGVTLNASNITTSNGSNSVGGVTLNASNITTSNGSNSVGGVILSNNTITASGKIYSGGFTGPAASTINGIGIDPTNQNMSSVGTVSCGTITASGKIYSGGFTGPASSTINGIGIDPTNQNMSSVGTISASSGSSSIGGVTLNNGTITGYLEGNISGSSATCRGNAATASNFYSIPDIIVGTIGCSVITASGKIYSGGFTGPASSTINGISINPTNQNMTSVGTISASSGSSSIGGVTLDTNTITASGKIYSGGFTGPASSTINGISINPTNQNMSSVGAITAPSINNGAATFTVTGTTSATLDTLTVGAPTGGSATGNAIKTTGTVNTGALTATSLTSSGGIAAGGAITGVTTLAASGVITSTGTNYGNIQLRATAENVILFADTNAGTANTGWYVGQSTSSMPSPGFAIARLTANSVSTSTGIYVMSSGNVGIGCNAPVYPLDVTGAIRATGNLISADRPGGAGGNSILLVGNGVAVPTVATAASSGMRIMWNTVSPGNGNLEIVAAKGGATGAINFYAGVADNTAPGAPSFTINANSITSPGVIYANSQISSSGPVRAGGGGGASGGFYTHTSLTFSTTGGTNYSLASGLTRAGVWVYTINGSVNSVSGMILVYRSGILGTYNSANSQLLGGSTQIGFVGNAAIDYGFTYYGNSAQTFMEASIVLLSSLQYA